TTQPGRQRGSVRRLERLAQLKEQVVEGLHAQLASPPRQLDPGFAQEVDLHRAESDAYGATDALQRVGERLDDGEHLVRTWRGALLPAAGERVRPELHQLLEGPQPGQVGTQVAVHATQPRGHRRLPVLVLVQPWVAQQLVDSRARVRPRGPESLPR